MDTSILLSSIIDVLSSAYASLFSALHAHSYAALFTLMLLESSSLPVPSEVIIPAAGYFAAQGIMNTYIAFVMILIASFIGLVVDYYIGYYIGKEFVYGNLHLIHVKESTMHMVEDWFQDNGAFTVFVVRFVPFIRTLINFPAGFAMMPKRTFFLYSFAGCFLWDLVLFVFGYYLISVRSIVVAAGAAAILVIVLYFVYTRMRKRMLHSK